MTTIRAALIRTTKHFVELDIDNLPEQDLARYILDDTNHTGLESTIEFGIEYAGKLEEIYQMEGGGCHVHRGPGGDTVDETIRQVAEGVAEELKHW